MKIGAKNFIVSKDEEQMKGGAGSLDLILNTVSANHQEWLRLFFILLPEYSYKNIEPKLQSDN